LREDFGKSTKEELGEDRRERERERWRERDVPWSMVAKQSIIECWLHHVHQNF
jgi:hypothetical protein